MQKMSLSKGFTLIELLVVIAIIGILAAVVLIAINPVERIREANDTGKKSNLSQVANALETCYTQKATQYYDGCLSVSALNTGGFLKTAPSGVTVAPATGTNVINVVAYAPLEASSATCATGTAANKYMVFRSATGQSRIECLAGAPTP